MSALLDRIRILLTGKMLPKIIQPRSAEPSIINEKTVREFARVVEETGILKGATPANPDKR